MISVSNLKQSSPSHHRAEGSANRFCVLQNPLAPSACSLQFHLSNLHSSPAQCAILLRVRAVPMIKSVAWPAPIHVCGPHYDKSAATPPSYHEPKNSHFNSMIHHINIAVNYSISIAIKHAIFLIFHLSFIACISCVIASISVSVLYVGILMAAFLLFLSEFLMGRFI